jgi:hypothetical protein
MAKSVEDLPKEIKKYIDVYEWDMRTVDGNLRFFELKGKCFPSLALEGELVFESLIPGQEELAAEIIRRWRIKNRSVSSREG